tara:strand:+ start:3566 stop:3934 length:369 start_codon:yes stop_codon:yes gene_type:complete
MTVCFDENIYIKTFDEKGYYPLKIRKCKDFDGPNNFSILWNQLLILLHNNKIYDNISLYEKFNPKILKLYKCEILNEIDKNLYKFLELKYDSITLYYNKYHIKRDKYIILKLAKLYKLLENL